ncbi:MAG: hypothetical protein K2P85_13470 [Flavobacteriaceae bacterium]|nr:hypothetical protein [Flavobacteriaceae bacterium]
MRNKIENTTAWKALSKLQQSIYGKRQNILSIEGQFIVAKNTSREQWLNDYQPPLVFKNIINELLDDHERN